MSNEEMQRMSELATKNALIDLGESRAREILEKEREQEKFKELQKNVLQYKFKNGSKEEIDTSLSDLSLNGLITNTKAIQYLEMVEEYHLLLSKKVNEKNEKIKELKEDIKIMEESNEETDRMADEEEKAIKKELLN